MPRPVRPWLEACLFSPCGYAGDRSYQPQTDPRRIPTASDATSRCSPCVPGFQCAVARRYSLGPQPPASSLPGSMASPSTRQLPRDGWWSPMDFSLLCTRRWPRPAVHSGGRCSTRACQLPLSVFLFQNVRVTLIREFTPQVEQFGPWTSAVLSSPLPLPMDGSSTHRRPVLTILPLQSTKKTRGENFLTRCSLLQHTSCMSVVLFFLQNYL